MCYNPCAIMMKAWTAFLLVCAAASVVAWAVALCHENRVCPFAAAARFVRGLPWGGRLALLPLFVALIVYGGTKTGNVGANQVSGRVESVEGVDNVANVEVLPVANPNTQLENDTGNWQQSHTGNVNNSHLSSPISHYSSLITEGDCEAGFVLSGVGYGEVFDFAPTDDAVVCDDWLRFGAHEDWFHLPLGWFSFPFGSNVVNALTVLSSGSLYPAITNASTFIAPLKASLGIVPMANWGRIDFGRVERAERVDGDESNFGRVESVERVDGDESNFNAEKAETREAQSCFWHCVSKTNTVVFTWQNVLLEREAGKPVSFQCEISHNGDMMFRYDLKAIATTNAVPFPKVEIGAKNSAQGVLIDSTAATSNLCDTLRLCASALKTGTLSSLRFSHLDRQDYLVPDRDGDGISTADEIFIHRTDPGNADTDMDGLSDGEELTETETDPLNPFSINPSLPDGIAVKLGDADPFSVPQGSTNTVLEHLFRQGQSPPRRGCTRRNRHVFYL